MKLLFVSLFSLAMGLSGYGQRSVINFKHYSTNDGLSQNTVYCILQDHKGFMWVGTEDGLNKFDGYDFSVYKHENENKNSLSSSKINAILEDNNKDLWVGTGNGLNVYDRKKK